MSDSKETRRADALGLLRSIFAEIGNASIDNTLLDLFDSPYTEIKPTSWDELSAEGLVVKLNDRQYVLTALGWAEALARAELPSDPEFLKLIGQLSQVLKAKVKGRSSSALVPFDEIVKDSGLPSGWVFNVIDSHLISRLHGRKDASWFQNARGRLVEIPRDFGLETIDLFVDLRAENERLKEEAEHLHELYADSRCSTCSAPLVTVGQWEHEYGSEEVRQYACGMTVGAPNGDIPCTKDPHFPKFDEFQLVTNFDGGMWLCYASHNPKSRFAGSVTLMPTNGKTEDEAKEAMKEEYRRRAAPWSG